MCRRNVPHEGPKASVTAEIVEGLKLVWQNRTLFSLAWVAALWQLLHHMQLAVLILFATRDLGLSAGAIGLTYAFGGVGCVIAAASAEKLSIRYGVGTVIVHGLMLTAVGWQAFGLVSGPVWLATYCAGIGDAGIRLRCRVVRDKLPRAAPGHYAGSADGTHDGDDALPDRCRRAAGFARRWRAGDGDWPAQYIADGGRPGAGIDRRRRALVARASASDSARHSGGMMSQPR